jgi:hypothetical protein
MSWVFYHLSFEERSGCLPVIIAYFVAMGFYNHKNLTIFGRQVDHLLAYRKIQGFDKSVEIHPILANAFPHIYFSEANVPACLVFLIQEEK